MLQDNHTLVGTAGATTIVTATITDAGAYNVTLSGPIDHPVAGQEDDTTLTVPISVSDGHTTTWTTLSVSIEDDSPKAAPVEVSVDTTDSQTNVMVILDVSGSMSSNAGLDDHPTWTRLEAAIAAIDDLLDQYDSLGDVRVQIVKFSTGAEQVGSDWMTVAAAKDAIDGLTANGSTNYDLALTEAMNIFGHAGQLSGSGTQNVSYFLSDGEPSAEHGVDQTQQDAWESFLTTNDMVSFALGISNGAPGTENLAPIAFDPASGTQLADTPIIVTDLDQLTDTLIFTASSVSGSVLSGANSFGADGGHVQSITVDGVTYTFDPTANGGAGGITVSGDGSFTYNGTTKTLTVDTGASGGALAMVMTTGAFTFQPATGFSSESVTYVLVDADGDTASSTLRFSPPNITLVDGDTDTQTFDDMATGAITNGENGWRVLATGRDQEVVDLGGDHGHAFRMSSDPSVADFAGPYSPALSVTAGEPQTSASYDSQSITFEFKPVNSTPDGSRLEVDFGKSDGTDRNNFMVIESFGGATDGIRIAVAEPSYPSGSFGVGGTAPNDWRELVSHVDPTVWHDIELRLTYLDGANNDVIDVYLDGELIGTTTTFENYRDALGGTHFANVSSPSPPVRVSLPSLP
jgi:uncharacterized protein YegL